MLCRSLGKASCGLPRPEPEEVEPFLGKFPRDLTFLPGHVRCDKSCPSDVHCGIHCITHKCRREAFAITPLLSILLLFPDCETLVERTKTDSIKIGLR